MSIIIDTEFATVNEFNGVINYPRVVTENLGQNKKITLIVC